MITLGSGDAPTVVLLPRTSHPPSFHIPTPMHKLLGFLGLTLGGWGGWHLGALASVGAAIILGIVGSGVGLYVGRRISHDHF